MEKSKKFEGEGYSLSIISKNIAVTDAIEKYILEKISKIERFAHNIIDIVVTLDIQKVTNTVSIVMKFLHFKIKVQAQTEDMYSAIDKATERILKLIQKYKTKLQSHRVSESPLAPMRVSILEPVNDIDEINDQIAEENLKEEENLYREDKNNEFFLSISTGRCSAANPLSTISISVFFFRAAAASYSGYTG